MILKCCVLSLYCVLGFLIAKIARNGSVKFVQGPRHFVEFCLYNPLQGFLSFFTKKVLL